MQTSVAVQVMKAGYLQPHPAAAPFKAPGQALRSSRRLPLAAISAVAAPELQQTHTVNAGPTLNKVFMAAASVGCAAAASAGAAACSAASS